MDIKVLAKLLVVKDGSVDVDASMKQIQDNMSDAVNLLEKEIAQEKDFESSMESLVLDLFRSNGNTGLSKDSLKTYLVSKTGVSVSDHQEVMAKVEAWLDKNTFSTKKNKDGIPNTLLISSGRAGTKLVNFEK